MTVNLPTPSAHTADIFASDWVWAQVWAKVWATFGRFSVVLRSICPFGVVRCGQCGHLFIDISVGVSFFRAFPHYGNKPGIRPHHSLRTEKSGAGPIGCLVVHDGDKHTQKKEFEMILSAMEVVEELVLDSHGPLLLSRRLVRALGQDMSPQELRRWLYGLADDLGRPIAARWRGNSGYYVLVAAPTGWSADQVRGFIGALFATRTEASVLNTSDVQQRIDQAHWFERRDSGAAVVLVYDTIKAPVDEPVGN